MQNVEMQIQNSESESWGWDKGWDKVMRMVQGYKASKSNVDMLLLERGLVKVRGGQGARLPRWREGVEKWRWEWSRDCGSNAIVIVAAMQLQLWLR